jgi:predicted metal-dependent peptidase
MSAHQIGRHSARATRALRRLGEDDPAFAALALWCDHRDSDARPLPAWTDGTTIFYGPAFEALPLHEQTGLAAHHVLHVALRHGPRARSLWSRFGDRFDPELFNAAADSIVNETLIRAGHSLPRPCVLLTELLRDSFGETTAPDTALAAWDAEKLYIRLAHGPEGAQGRRASGDGAAQGPSPAERARAHARARAFEADLEPAGTDGDPARDAAEAVDWRQRLTRALEAGRAAGRGIGALGHRLADLPEATTPWEVVLRGLVARAVTPAPRRSHRRPTNRWIALDADARATGGPEPVFEPGLARDRMIPRVAVAIDASGSIDAARLALFAAQVAGIGRRTGAEVHVLVFDDGLRAQTRMQGSHWEAEITRIAFARGGGTSFVEVLAAAARLDPAIVVVLTDLDGEFGPPPGRVPVIWAVPEEPATRPPFGRVLSLAR